MAKITLIIPDPTQRITLRAMLEAEGHTIVEEGCDAVFASSPETAVTESRRVPTILLATASQIPAAVEAMRHGVWGYVFVPFQAREVAMAVERALATEQGEGAPETLRSLDSVEMEHIQRVLRACKHNQAKAARVLGIGRNTLWRKLKATGGSDKADE